MLTLSFIELLNLSKKKYQVQSERTFIKIIFFLSKIVKDSLSLTSNLKSKIDFKVTKYFKILNQHYLKGKPLAYLLKYEDFYNLRLKINKKVFIPRNETELLCEKVIKYLKPLSKLEILDLCSGSGAIGITIKKYCPQHNITCVDNSFWSINNIRQNAKLNQVEIKVISSDYLSFILNTKQRFDVLVCNPPYINSKFKLPVLVAKYNPQKALSPKKDELIFYKNIINNYKKIMNCEFLIAFEIGFDQKLDIEKLLKKYSNIFGYECVKDYANLDRDFYIWNQSNKII